MFREKYFFCFPFLIRPPFFLLDSQTKKYTRFRWIFFKLIDKYPLGWYMLFILAGLGCFVNIVLFTMLCVMPMVIMVSFELYFYYFQDLRAKCSSKSFSFLLTNKFMKTSLSDDIRITATINKFVSLCLQMQWRLVGGFYSDWPLNHNGGGNVILVYYSISFVKRTRLCNKSNTTGGTRGTGTAYPFWSPEFTPVFSEVRVTRSLVSV